MIAMKGPPKDRFMRKKSQLHRDLEAGKIEATVIIGKGMSNPKKMTSQI